MIIEVLDTADRQHCRGTQPIQNMLVNILCLCITICMSSYKSEMCADDADIRYNVIVMKAYIVFSWEKHSFYENWEIFLQSPEQN